MAAEVLDFVTNDDKTVTLAYQCPLCQKPASVTVDAERAKAWRAGAGFVQDIFPDMSAGDREILISGAHDACFEETFADSEDGE
jgi:hypothetical protein